MGAFIEVVLGGLMAGVLYSLVALGFVLIYKASGVFNFAQGAMVLLAALAFARFSEVMPMPVAFVFATLLMVGAAFARSSMVEALKQTVDEPKRLGASGVDDGRTVKLTLRLPVPQTDWLVEHARAAGLSYGIFLASVIDGTLSAAETVWPRTILMAIAIGINTMTRVLNWLDSHVMASSPPLPLGRLAGLPSRRPECHSL